MNFNWSEYLTLAQVLTGKATVSSPEAKFRSAISRAYYGAFCSTRNYLIKQGHEIPKTGEAHKVVREIFMNKKDLLSKQIESNLDRLRKDRNDADYEDQFPGALNEKTALDLSRAQKVLNDLAKC
jgi:uncharacterized protein (UPF0332 family)